MPAIAWMSARYGGRQSTCIYFPNLFIIFPYFGGDQCVVWVDIESIIADFCQGAPKGLRIWQSPIYPQIGDKL